MAQLLEHVLEGYFSAYRELIEAEEVDDTNVVVSFPLHYVGNHRVEVSVTKSVDDRYIVSDMGRTIGQMKEYGYVVSPSLLSRMEQIAKPCKVNIVDETMISQSTIGDIGPSLHSFAEAAKTIGDAYLAFRVKTQLEKRLLDAIREIFADRQIAYKLDQKVRGKIDLHPVDFYIPPNGHPGLALGVLGGYNTHTTAQVWYFKCQDIRMGDARLKVGLVYDVEESTWSQKSQRILHDVADFALPSDQIRTLGDTVTSAVS